MLRQEGALDRSIDRKVRILLALRREWASGKLPGTAPEGDNDVNMAEADKVLDTEVPAGGMEAGATAQSPKMKERSLNVAENKGPLWKTPERSWNVGENKGSYAFKPGMCVKTGRLTAPRNSKQEPGMTYSPTLGHTVASTHSDLMSLRT
jgi:hypothetical protein